jgi:formate hydrogenlyase transcriptional activator
MKKKDTDKGPIEDFVGQKHAKIELIKEQEENYLDNIINNIGDSLFVKDENSILTLVNDAFCTLFDLERDNILGKTLAADISPEEMDGFLKIDREVLKTGNENIIEESLTVRDGQTKTISTRKTRYIASNGDKYLIGVTRDITNRKNYEKELEEGEANISTILNSLPASVCVINDTGKILQVNDSWKEFADSNKTLNGIDYYSKYNYFDVCKQDIQDDNSRIILEGLLDLFANKTTEFEYEYPCHSPNRKQWFSMRADLMKSKEKQVVISHTDITFRKLDEENRKETLARLNLAVDTAKLAVWQLTVDSGELLWNDRHLEFYGISREAFNTDTEVWRNQIHPADKNYVDSRFQEVFERKSINDVNFRIIRPNGDIRYLSGSATPIVIDGKLVKVIGVNRDITESKQSEKKLKESEERIRLFTQNVPDFLLQVDRAGRINYINKTLEVLAQKDVIGSSIYSWIPKQTSEKFKDKLENVFSTGGSEIIEHAGNGLKGEPLWFETQMGPLEKSGIITQVIIVSRDITERKTAELDLKKALDKNIELKQQIEAENIYLKEELKLEGSFNEIVGSSKSLKKVLKQVEQVAKTDSTVLILGETGTGKELIAKAIHNASDRKAKPLVKVNCSALPADLIESEFFGHEKGAFTGALNRKIGRFELANGGTIFLDEIGDLPIGLQTRLLRVLQESEFERVGGEKTIKVDVRVITATNRNLKKQVLENNFRQDLYYRLNVFPIECPTLRNRVDDIPSLVHHFVNKYNPKVNNRIKTVHQKTIERLMHYNWPGNIRELENVIERAIIVNQGSQLRLGKWFMDSSIDTVVSDELKTMETVERDYIIKVLEKTNWKIRGKNGAAQLLGMQPTTLESRMKKKDIKR